MATYDLSKGDLVIVATARGVARTTAGLWAMPRANLAAEVAAGGLVSADFAPLVRARAARAAWSAANPHAGGLDSLKCALRDAGVTAPGLSFRDRDGLIDALATAGVAVGAPMPAAPAGAAAAAEAMYGGAAAEPVAEPELPLDDFQAAAVARWNAPLLLINAGPGAGKTTTVCRFVRRALAERPRDRVLVLAYNVEAGRVLADRVARAAPRPPVISLGRGADARRVLDPAAVGVAVMTFHQFAGHVCNFYGDVADDANADDAGDMYGAPAAAAPAAPPAASPDTFSHDASVARAAMLIRARGAPAPFDLVVVDEAQDVLANLAELADALVAAGGRGGPGDAHAPPRLVVAGDPRQELYAGAMWFSSLWAATPAAARLTLSVNHRSAPAIVEFLNDFSRVNFPSLHSPQIAGRAADGAAADHVRVVWVQVDTPACARGCLKGAPGAPLVSRAVFCRDCRLGSARDVGEVVGGLIAECDAANVYAVAPCTVNKWSLAPATLRAREEIHRKRPGAPVAVADDDAIQSTRAAARPAYAIATATKLKGTERARVVVFGADLDYDLALSRPAQLKRLFVALSRARDELVVVLRTRIDSGVFAALAPLRASFAKAQVVAAAPDRAAAAGDRIAARPLKVVDDLAGCSAIRVMSTPRGVAPALGVPVDNDADFVGLYAEALVASALGLPLATRVVVVEAAPQESEHVKRVLGADGTLTYVVRCRTRRAAAIRAEIATASDAAAGGDSAYLHCMLVFCATIGTAWTVSKRLAHATAEFAPKAEAAAAWLRAAAPGARFAWGATAVHCVAAARSPHARSPHARSPHADAPSADIDDPSAAGAVPVAYEPDLVAWDDAGAPALVVELKHVAELGATHRRQAAVYAAILNAPRALLLNLRDGAAEDVAAAAHPEFARAVRAVSAIRAGRSAAARRSAVGPAADFAGVAAPEGFAPACVIALDIETAVGGLVTEVGAAAFSAVDWRLLGTFAEIAPGVIAGRRVARPGTAAHRVELVTGLGVADAAALAESQAALRRRLLDFADGFAPVGARTWATYGGGDAAWLGEPTVDVLHRMFRPWRERVGGESAAASLELAATLSASIPGDSPLKPRSGCVFAPHVAFEDAIATAAVLAATLRTDGEL